MFYVLFFFYWPVTLVYFLKEEMKKMVLPSFLTQLDNFRFTNVMYKVNYEIFYRYLTKLT